jgi:uncharacterized protein YjbI with pentapeptide repeats
LRSFLDAGASEILLRIERMEEHRRALGATAIKIGETYYDLLLKLLKEGNVEKFNSMRHLAPSPVSDFRGIDLSHANLSGIDLSGDDFTHADFTLAKTSYILLSG